MLTVQVVVNRSWAGCPRSRTVRCLRTDLSLARSWPRLISAEFFEISPRTLEHISIPYKLLNGRAMYDPAVGLEYARQRVAEAPAYRGGRRRRAV